MSSAPEHAERLAKRWLKLPKESRERLTYLWLNRGVRVHAAKAFDAVGHREAAARLRDLSEITSEEGCLGAAKALSAEVRLVNFRAGTGREAMACLFCVLSLLDRKAAVSSQPRPDAHIFGICVGIVTAARLMDSGVEEEQMESVDVAAAVSL